MHLLDETNGIENAMISVGATPWHRHGLVVPTAPRDTEHLLQMLPSLDFQVQMADLNAYWDRPMELGGDVDVDVPSHRAIMRSDSGAVLGVVGNRYRPHQIRDGLRILDPIIESGAATIETAGSLRGGANVWALTRFDVDSPVWRAMVDELGEIKQYAIVRLDHTGKGASKAFLTGVRVVCANTDAMAMSRDGKTGVSVPHVGDVRAKFADASEALLGDITEHFEMLAARNLLLAGKRLTDAEFKAAVLDPVGIVPTDPTKFSSAGYFEGARDRAEAKRTEVTRMWSEGAGHTGNHSAYEAVQGLIEALDHNAKGAFAKQRDVATLLDGQLSQLKSRVTRNCLDLALAAA